MSRTLRLLSRAGIAVLALLLGVTGVVWWLLDASLPQLEGELDGLGINASIERDAAGTPTVTAATRHDLAFATGFVHAQDRFFQMDLMRRAAAGELSELLGPAVVESDRRLRVHGFRRVAREVMEQMQPEDGRVLDAYAAGVNAGLARLSASPWEYLALRTRPRAWSVEDCLLAAFSMYLTLNDTTGAAELARSELQQALPPQLFAFLHPVGTEWDAPITGGSWRVPDIPGPDVFDLRRDATRSAALADPPSKLTSVETPMVGSNSWAVAATHSASGRALLANDMHLGLRLPHVWYRARLIVSGEPRRDLIGVTLPGLPLVVVGSNGHVSWGFTNSYGDWTDLVIVEVDPADPARYLVGDTSEPFVRRSETIAVRGEAAVSVEVRSTRWGPIVAEDSQGRPLALMWTAHHARATNVRLMDLESVHTVEQALLVANHAGAPVQNFVAADDQGHIGWTILGQVPVRANYDPSVPASWRPPHTGWTGWRQPQEYPRVMDPPAGRLWTANTRTIDAETWLTFLGDGGYDVGARAGQIRDSLLALRSATSEDLAKLQIDDRALFLARWRDLLLELLDDSAVEGNGARAEARDLVRNWSGRAAVEDAGYGIVRAFRLQVRKDVFDAITAKARLDRPGARFAPSPQFEGALWQVVTQRPAHLLDPMYVRWEDALLASLDASLMALREECGSLAACTWGRQNRLHMLHSLSSALPFASHWLDMPDTPMPGDSAMPRVQGRTHGASQRMVVSPGHEAEGLFQMPGGPVDHPLSPFYAAGHEQWVRGEPGPLLPGRTQYRLELRP